MPLGDVYDNALLDAAFGDNHAPTFPNTLYAAAYHEVPTKAGGGVEVSYAGYSRVLVSNVSSVFPDAEDGEKTNAVQIDFATPGDALPSPIVAFAFHAHPTNDTIVAFEELVDPLTVLEDEPLYVPEGALALVPVE